MRDGVVLDPGTPLSIWPCLVFGERRAEGIRRVGEGAKADRPDTLPVSELGSLDSEFDHQITPFVKLGGSISAIRPTVRTSLAAVKYADRV